MSILDSVAAKVRSRTSKPVTLGHPEILELSVVYRTPTDRTEIQKIKRRADAQKDAGDFDASLLAACCEEITEYGQTVTDDEGLPVTFRDKAMHEKLGVASARDAVRTFYGSDGYVSSTAARLMEAAGWGAIEEVEVIEDDPTSSS